MGTIWGIVLGVIILSLVYVFFNYRRIKAMNEGTDEMVEMAAIIRSGANTFMKTEYKTIFIVVLIVALIFSLFVEKTSGLTLLLGALASSAACITGMKSATFANVRTSNKARESLSIGETVKVALSGGSVAGLSVQAFGLLGLVVILFIWGIDHDASGSGFHLSLKCHASTMSITTY